MAKRRKKRGRPRTGRDPVVGVRLPPAQLKRVDKIATALSWGRSRVLRWVFGLGMEGVPSILFRSGKGRNLTDAIALAMASEIRAKAAVDAVKRARPADKPQAEIKALRAEEEAAERQASIADRLALRRAPGVEPPRQGGLRHGDGARRDPVARVRPWTSAAGTKES